MAVCARGGVAHAEVQRAAELHALRPPQGRLLSLLLLVVVVVVLVVVVVVVVISILMIICVLECIYIYIYIYDIEYNGMCMTHAALLRNRGYCRMCICVY